MQFLQEQKTVAEGSNSFSTVQMDMGMSGCSKPLGEKTTSIYDLEYSQSIFIEPFGEVT